MHLTPSGSHLSSTSNSKSRKAKSKRSTKSAPNGTSRRSSTRGGSDEADDGCEEGSWLKYKKEYERFHAENGVRTVIGQIGPIKGGEFL